jgi:hypothetical protein
MSSSWDSSKLRATLSSTTDGCSTDGRARPKPRGSERAATRRHKTCRLSGIHVHGGPKLAFKPSTSLNDRVVAASPIQSSVAAPFVSVKENRDPSGAHAGTPIVTRRGSSIAVFTPVARSTSVRPK